MDYSINNAQSHNQRLRNVFKVIIVLLILGTVSACETKFLYNLIDTLIVKSLDQYFDLNQDQKRFLKDRLEYKLNVHRTHGIPKHIAFIKGIQERIQKGLNNESIKWFIPAMMKQFDLVKNLFFDDSVEFLMTLQRKQIDYFERKLSEQNEEYQKQHENLSDKRTENNPEEAIESLEEWLGPISDIQKKEILQMIRQMPDDLRQQDDSKQDYFESLERQQKFLKALRTIPKNREKVEKALNEIINPIKASLKDTIVLFMDLIVKIDKLITLKQRNYLIEQTDYWIDKLGDLMDT